MKTKDLKKHINELVEEVQVKDFDSSLLKDITYQPNLKRQYNNTNKWLFGLILSCALIVIAVIAVINIDGNIVPFDRNEIKMSKTKKQLAYQTLGVYSLIEASSIHQTLLLTKSNYDEVKKEIDYYLILAQNYLNLSDIDVKLYKIDNKLYQYMYNFKVNNEEVAFYFNEETQTDTDDIDEVSSTITGCLYMNKKEYHVIGEKEVEKAEIEMTLMIYLTDTYYIEVNQEIENAENEYEFIYYNQNKKEKTLEIEIEQEPNVKKVCIEDKDYEGKISNKMEFEMADNRILCDIQTKSYKGEVIILIQNGKYEYIFEEED